MTQREEVELVLLRYRDGYYRKPLYMATATEITQVKENGHQIPETEGAIDAIIELFDLKSNSH